MVAIPTRYFTDIGHYLFQGKVSAAFARGMLPLIFQYTYYVDQLKYQFILFKNRNQGGEIIVKVNDLYDMRLDLQDKGICQELSIHHKREYFTTDYFKEIIRNDMVIIEIGANIGYYALLESALSPEARIYAIEPVPQNFAMLNKNIELNDRQNILLFNFAIGDVNGNSTMYIYDGCNWCSFTKNPSETVVSTVTVPLMTLDEFIEKYMSEPPNFIRMDVEGYEYNILKGALHSLQSISPLMICIEFHPHLMSKENTMECVHMLKKSGFKVKSIIREINSFRYNYLGLINKFHDILNWPPYGYYGNDYALLEEALAHGFGAMVFFEKTDV